MATAPVRYRLVVDIGTGEHGKRKQITRTFDKLKEACAELARIRHETGLGTYVGSAPVVLVAKIAVRCGGLWPQA